MVRVVVPSFELRVQELGFRIWGLGFGVWGLGFEVHSSGFRVSDLRARSAHLHLLHRHVVLHDLVKDVGFNMLLKDFNIPHGRVRPSHQKSICITQSTLGPHVVQIWSRNSNIQTSETRKIHGGVIVKKKIHIFATVIYHAETEDHLERRELGEGSVLALTTLVVAQRVRPKLLRVPLRDCHLHVGVRL